MSFHKDIKEQITIHFVILSQVACNLMYICEYVDRVN
jgi:hypothetical protein